MPIVRQPIVYDGPDGPFEGVIAYDDEIEAARPGVLILPNVLGQKEADNLRAEEVAKLGYIGFAADVFGQGKRTNRDMPDPAVYMNALNADRALLRDRLAAALAAFAGYDPVDPARIAAIGYCFGGKCVLDMARAGMAIRGGVSFHGIYDRPDWAGAQPIAAKLLVCHGWDDPLAPPAAVSALAEELSAAGADWQLLAFGQTGHAFTDTSMPVGVRPGMGYSPDADRRSWDAAKRFLAELFV